LNPAFGGLACLWQENDPSDRLNNLPGGFFDSLNAMRLTHGGRRRVQPVVQVSRYAADVMPVDASMRPTSF
jgi:hypothetical protein